MGLFFIVVIANSESKLDDILNLEVFESKDMTESSSFSDKVVILRRQPVKEIFFI